VDPDAAARLRELISKGASGFTAGFTTAIARRCTKIGNHLRIVQLAAPPQKLHLFLPPCQGRPHGGSDVGPRPGWGNLRMS
jgi:hypothetical protein